MKDTLLFILIAFSLSFSSNTSKDPRNFRHLISDMVKQKSGVVVSIHTSQKQKFRQFNNPWEEFFYGKGQQRQAPKVQQGLGSGVIVKKNGTILTNNHVVEGADEITVQLQDNRKFSAEIIGRDPETDLAVIKITEEIKNLPIAPLGDSDHLLVGEWVVAIGNPFGLNHTVTTGIVSAKEIHGRGITQYENFIQTDAAINPGNSGGALLDLDGNLIGINTAILSRSGGFQGIGFAIPINMAKRVMNSLITTGEVSRGWLGVSIQDIDESLMSALNLPSQDGVLISEIMPNSPAAKSKLQEGDVILSLNQKQIKNTNELRNNVALVAPNTMVKFGVLRQGVAKVIEVKIGSKDGENSSGQTNSFGIRFETKTKKLNSSDVSGILVTRVKPQSPAALNGVKEGDFILKVNHQRVKDAPTFTQNLKTLLKHKKGFLYVLRNNHKFFLPIRLK